MADHLRFDVDTRALERDLRMIPRQVPFAFAKALNTTATHCRAELQAEARRVFVIRNKFTLNGITVNYARKNTLVATVGVLEDRWWLPSQALGESNRKPPDGGDVAISPMPGTTRSDVTDEATPRKDKAKAISRPLRIDRIGTNRRGYFVPDGLAKPGMLYRAGPTQPSKRKTMRGKPVPALVRPSYPVARAYTFADSVDIKQRWDFERTVSRTVERRWPEAVEEAVIEALWTSR